MSDIVERLRAGLAFLDEAADEIERLRGEVTRRDELIGVWIGMYDAERALADRLAKALEWEVGASGEPLNWAEPRAALAACREARR